MDAIEFTVLGEPAPKGSMKAFVRPGMKFATLVHDNKKTVPWCDNVRSVAWSEYRSDPYQGPVAIQIDLFFARPASHFGTGGNAGKVKPKSPWYKTTKPDVDKLCRAILDALSGTVYADDKQVVKLIANKRYTGSTPRARVKVQFLDDHGQATTSTDGVWFV